MFHGQGNQHTHIMYTHIGAMRMESMYVYRKNPLVEGVNIEAARVEMYKLLAQDKYVHQ